MTRHIPFSKLADLAEGRVEAAERSESLAHISECSPCAAQKEKLESVINLMRTDQAEDAPRELVAHTINLWRTRASVSKTPGLIQRIVAVLRFDSFQTAPAYAVRSGQAAARQLLYNAGDYDVELRIAPSGEAWDVSGQVFGRECAGGQIEMASASLVAQADLNDQCEFALAGLSIGSYQLRLRLTDLEVEIPQLELKA
jgi:hypothetical protein